MDKIINDKSDIVFGYNIELYNNNYYIFKALKESMMYTNDLNQEVVDVNVVNVI